MSILSAGESKTLQGTLYDAALILHNIFEDPNNIYVPDINAFTSAKSKDEALLALKRLLDTLDYTLVQNRRHIDQNPQRVPDPVLDRKVHDMDRVFQMF